MRRLAACLAVLMLLGVVGSATAATTDSQHRILDQINAERAARGLRPMRIDARLWDLAGDRATRMAQTGILSHAVAGNVGTSLKGRGIQYYAYGEDIGYSTAARGRASSDELFTLWRASPDHWALMMSDRYNYVGIGLAFRSSTGQTFGSIVFTESRDRSGPKVTVAGPTRNAHDVRWTWVGVDPLLQTHTAGVASYQVQLRVDSGAWTTLVRATKVTGRTLRDLRYGHLYRVRIRATDKVGNVGPWSAESRIRLP